MSIIGPRLALWNQDYLIAEGDKYEVNRLRPGALWWAQINLRATLPIIVKANLDGFKVKKSFCYELYVY